MSLEITSKIDKQKEELSSWKTKLIKNLSINTYITEDLFIISNFWFNNYSEYIFNFGKEGAKKFNLEENKGINNIVLSIISNQNIEIKRLPKVFILNKTFWNKIETEYEQLNSIMSKGYFSYEILVLKAFEKLYLFFFLDSNTKIRQGYLQIIDTNKEFQIISDLKNDGVFAFIKKDKNEINDKELFINNENYKLYITNFSDKNEENKDIFNLKFEDIIEKTKKFRTTILKKKKDFEINAKEIMEKGKEGHGKIMNKIKLIFKSYENINTEMTNLKSTRALNLVKPEISLNNDDTKKVKKKFPRNSSLKNRILKKSSRKLNDGNFDLSQFLPKKPVVNLAIPGIIGLQNIGATCYMNATLQCFSNTPKLRSYLLNKDNYSDLEHNKESTNKLSFALAEVLKNLWEILTQRDYPPNHFKNVISEMNPLFKGIKANDPKDLILFLLETMHNELNKAPNENLKTNYIDDTYFESVFYDFYQNYMNKNKSIIAEEFNGYTNSMTSCGYCRTTIHNVQTFNILFFPLEEIRKFMNYKHNNVWIKDGFQFYQKNNIFPSFYCNKCKYLCQSINTNRLIYTPQTLIISLNRGRGLEYNVNIIFDEYLNIREFIFSPESPYYYELTGVICHFGSNDEGGHFIAYCKNSNNCEWYKFNDSFVSKCYFYEVQNANLPYVLFYNYVQV